jgi:hypothetical protein
LQMARQAGREAATKATITKLNSIIMQRYESYMTRRVPIQIPRDATPRQAATVRLYALRNLMRMEMPDSEADITFRSGPVPIILGTITVVLPEPALHVVYRNSPHSGTYDSAQCLYKIVSIGSPEAMEQFNSSEIGTVSDASGNHPVFIDGWGTPICWLRWAPGYSNQHGPPAPNPFTGIPAAPSDIQTGNASADPDPFDPRRVDVDNSNNPRAFHLIPLICSAGPDKKFGLVGLPWTGVLSRALAGPVVMDITKIFDPTTAGPYIRIGAPDTDTTHAGNVGTQNDNITNHHIEQR